MRHIISAVERGGIAEELGIEPGDALASVNGREVGDVFDFRFETADEAFDIVIEKPSGEQWELEIERGDGEELGISFEDGLMDEPRSCANRCVFCFIDQNPKGMRETIYFKDDDARLSFLRGNYVTLTNMGERDFERILKYHLSPINVSVHTTNPELRVKMLNNKNAGHVLGRVGRLLDAGITCNFQVVLCKGLNDGLELDKTIGDLAKLGERAASLSVVPAGLTKHRGGLYPLEAFSQTDCANVIRQVEGWQRRLRARRGDPFVYAADEFYLSAGIDIPDYEAYGGFPQLENGVGMLALEEREFAAALKGAKPVRADKSIMAITGQAAYGFIDGVCKRLNERFRGLNAFAKPIANDFFGRGVTVSGLLTAGDIIKAAKGAACDIIALPRNLLREGTDVLLDDVTVTQIENELGVPVAVLDSAAGLIDVIGKR